MTPSREILKEDGKEEKERRSLVRLEATESVRRILHEAAGLLQSSSKVRLLVFFGEETSRD